MALSPQQRHALDILVTHPFTRARVANDTTACPGAHGFDGVGGILPQVRGTTLGSLQGKGYLAVANPTALYADQVLAVTAAGMQAWAVDRARLHRPTGGIEPGRTPALRRAGSVPHPRGTTHGLFEALRPVPCGLCARELPLGSPLVRTAVLPPLPGLAGGAGAGALRYACLQCEPVTLGAATLVLFAPPDVLAGCGCQAECRIYHLRTRNGAYTRPWRQPDPFGVADVAA